MRNYLWAGVLWLLALRPVLADGPATMIITNANIITMDESLPRAEAVAVQGETIVYVGDAAGVARYAGSETKTIDLQGQTLVPGFNDDHTHTVAGGAFYMRPILYGLSCEQIVEVVRAEVEKARPGQTILASFWDFPFCPEPHKNLLDPVSPENPVILTQYGGHVAWVNQVQLDKMKITKDTPDPKGGKIDRDPETGEPTGILRETAMGPASYGNLIGDILSRERHRQLLEKSLALYREAGITSVQDNTWFPLTVWILNELKKEGKLTCRFTCWPYGEYWFAPPLMKLASYDETWVRLGPVKYFADGLFSAQTAWMTEEWYNQPGNYGLPRHAPEEIREIVLRASKKRQQITFHAIGDRAVLEVINAVEASQAQFPWTKDLRHRLEHVQIILPQDVPRLKALGMVASVQPFALCEPDKDREILGPERVKSAFPYLTLYQAGVPVAFGSDIPAEVDFQPLLGMYYACTRKHKLGQAGPNNPHERFTPYDALYCYTMGSAYAEFMEHKKGSISPGKLADMVVLSEDILKIDSERLKDVQVLMTIVGGRIVYEKKR